MNKIMPPTVLLVSVIAMVALNLLLSVMTIIPPYWNLLGIIPLAAGMILDLVASRAFRRVNTTVRPFTESSVLVTDGLFRVTRNPMYLGFVLIVTGLAVLIRSLTPWVVVLGFVILLDREYIVVEERMLGEKFGTRWIDYKQRTRRWL